MHEMACLTGIKNIALPWGARSTLLLSCTLSACARPAGPIFLAQPSPIVWPLPPDPPRIQFLGEIRGGQDLSPAKTGWQVFAEYLRGFEGRPMPFVRPHDVAIGTDESVYVADSGAACVHVLNLNTRSYRVIRDAGDERLVTPVAVTLGRASLFVADATKKAVYEYTLDGEFRSRVTVEVNRPAGLAYCESNDRLYVVDSAEHRCVILQRSSDLATGWATVRTFGGRGSDPGRFNYPTHAVCDPALGLLISDTLNFRVQRFDLDGQFQSSIGKKGNGAGDFSLPKGLAVDRDGHIYVVDAQFENIQLFRPDGRLLLAVGGEGDGAGSFSVPNGIAIDLQQRIWVADGYNRRLQVFQYLGDAS